MLINYFFKEVKFVQTPCETFDELGCVSKRGSHGLFEFLTKHQFNICVCVWIKVCQRQKIAKRKPQNDHSNVILNFSMAYYDSAYRTVSLVINFSLY